MQVVERINNTNSTVNNSINSNSNAQPKLVMVWQTEWRNGRQCLVANWVAE